MPDVPSRSDERHPPARRDHALAAGQLAIRSERRGSTHVVGLSGELDLATAPRVLAELQAVEASDASEIVLDLADLSFIDSSGLQLILRAAARSSADGKRLALRRGQARVHRIFELTATVDKLPFVD